MSQDNGTKNSIGVPLLSGGDRTNYTIWERRLIEFSIVICFAKSLINNVVFSTKYEEPDMIDKFSKQGKTE